MRIEVNNRILAIAFAFVVSLSLVGCVSGYSSGNYRGVNHYHHHMGVWGGGYYGGDVIIVDDGWDIGCPDVIAVPYDDY